MLEDTILKGTALKKFKEFVNAQGGDLEVINNTDLLPKSKYSEEVIIDEETSSSYTFEVTGSRSAGLLIREETSDSNELVVGRYLIQVAILPPFA
jgi:hypothetical protein